MVTLICNDDLAEEVIRRMLHAGVPVLDDFPDPPAWAGLAQDLRGVGWDVTDAARLPDACAANPQAVPILVGWIGKLQEVQPPSGNRDWLMGRIVRALARSGADITSVMLDFFPNAGGWLHGEVSHAIETSASAEHADRILDLVQDEQYGAARDRLVLLLKRVAKRHHRTLGVLTQILDDDTVAARAMDVLARLHPREAVDLIAPKLAHHDPWIARAAKINHRIALDKSTRRRTPTQPRRDPSR